MNFLKDNFFFLILFLATSFFMQGILNLPVLDRDEARFATASKTMLETKDFIDIRMHEETRYKKASRYLLGSGFIKFYFRRCPI